MNLGGARPFSLSERMVAMRYLRARKSEGGVALIAGISFACIVLAIASMIVIMSVMNGFRSEMVRLTVGAEGHVFVSLAQAGGVDDAVLNGLEAELGALPGVEEAFRYTTNLAGLQANGRLTAAQIHGIRPEDLAGFEFMRDALIAGTLDGFGEGRGGENRIYVGSRLANQLGVFPGDRVSVYSGRTRSTVAGTTPVIKPYTIGGIFETGVVITDQTFVFMSLDQTNLLFNEGRLQGDVQLRLTSADLVDDVAPRIANELSQPVFVMTWKDRNQAIATALRTEQVVMRLIFMIVVIIATFPVLAAMIMLVKNKSRDIAILRTIGATRGAVLRIFFMTGAVIGILGTVIGLLIGIVICLNIGAIQSFVELLTGRPLFPPEAYQLSGGLPSQIVWSEVALVAAWGIGISFLATLMPALSASRTDPVEALRYE